MDSTTDAGPPTYELVEHSNKDADALFSDFQQAPELSQIAPLRLPLCLPQQSAGPNTSFTRAYSQELHVSGIEMVDWMHFVDGLNIAMTASPPLRVVDLAGKVLGFVPFVWAQIASVSIQVVAQTGIHIIAKTLTDRLLRHANKDYFGPRGLCVRICKTAAMRQIIGLDPFPDPAASTGKVKKFAKGAGRVAETVVLHLPIASRVYNRVAPSAPAITPGNINVPEGGNTMASRRLAALEGYSLPLSFEVPPPEPVNGLMDKTSGLSVRLQKWGLGQAEATAERNRQLLAIAEGRATTLSPRPSSSNSNVFAKAWNAGREFKDDIDTQRALRRGRVNPRLQASVQIADRKEWNATDRLLWVVLLTAEQDAQILGREFADDDADIEEVSEEEWRAEMEHETAVGRNLMAENRGATAGNEN